MISMRALKVSAIYCYITVRLKYVYKCLWLTSVEIKLFNKLKLHYAPQDSSNLGHSHQIEIETSIKNDYLQ